MGLRLGLGEPDDVSAADRYHWRPGRKLQVQGGVMRVRKTVDSVLERFYYDGQMPIESDKSGVVARNFVAVRSIDAILTTNSSGTTTAYPFYDCDGNMVATLAKTGAGWSTGNLRDLNRLGFADPKASRL